ncbi:MAG: hypothetical protein QXF78_00035 [Pyrobaculum sp.]
MERLPEDVVNRLRELRERTESIGARAILNYVIYEFEVGGPSPDVITEAEELARREIDELKMLLSTLEELKKLVT